MKLWLLVPWSFVAICCASRRAPVATAERPVTAWIKMERTSCFGTCPNYVVEVAVDGIVRYEGRAGVCTMGTAIEKLSTEHMAALRSAIDRSGFGRAAETCCDCPITDVPETIVTVTTTAVSKTIHIVEMCRSTPKKMKQLGDEIDQIIGTQKWVGTDETRRDACRFN